MPIINHFPTLLRRQLVCEQEASTELQQRVITYFEVMGFTFAAQDLIAGKFRFEKGSLLGNVVTFNPLQWKSVVEVTIEEQQLTAHFYIHTTYQFPSNNDEALWDSFVSNFEKYLQEPAFNFKTANAQAIKVNKRKNRKYVGWALLGGLITGIPAGVMALWLDSPLIASGGAALGGLALMSKKIKADRVQAGIHAP